MDLKTTKTTILASEYISFFTKNVRDKVMLTSGIIRAQNIEGNKKAIIRLRDDQYLGQVSSADWQKFVDQFLK